MRCQGGDNIAVRRVFAQRSGVEGWNAGRGRLQRQGGVDGGAVTETAGRLSMALFNAPR